jgi:hypothetical protein
VLRPIHGLLDLAEVSLALNRFNFLAVVAPLELVRIMARDGNRCSQSLRDCRCLGDPAPSKPTCIGRSAARRFLNAASTMVISSDRA